MAIHRPSGDHFGSDDASSLKLFGAVKEASGARPHALMARRPKLLRRIATRERPAYRQTLFGYAKWRCNCDRTVIREAQNLDEHRGLQTHTEKSFWTTNSLIAYALTCLGVARYRSTASLSKRAPSTTRTSLPFRINDLRSRRGRVHSDCDKSTDGPRSLTGIPSIPAAKVAVMHRSKRNGATSGTHRRSSPMMPCHLLLA